MVSHDSAHHRGLVLVAVDEPAVAAQIRQHLIREAFDVHVERDGAIALAAVRRLRPVACVLDVTLPSLTGTEIRRRLRDAGDRTPIVLLVTPGEADHLTDPGLGTDDHVTKPVGVRKLTTRLHMVLRRAAGAQVEAEHPRQVGAVTLDPGRRTVTVAGTPVHLTSTEFDLLANLMAQPGRIFTREELLAAVWGGPGNANIRVIDVHVAQVRAKLGDASVIRTHRGVGYAING